MPFTYAASANNTTNGVALGTTGRDVYVKKLIIGKPVASANITLYNKAAAYNGDTADIAFKVTLPATISSSYTYIYPVVYDFTTGSNRGLRLDGGNLTVDQACQVTLIWNEVADDEK